MNPIKATVLLLTTLKRNKARKPDATCAVPIIYTIEAIVVPSRPRVLAIKTGRIY